ncbi:metallophosphoesterase family protein [Bradyrhizobium manausense]|uniref:metallophosphoesterase n=1 Tax=Bradyrhizobium manausense TaxID=989370 RepID=UPI001BAA52CE|nr:metallophosphoesterase [Bradyrhizobium manausense]MBR1089370.1 metallophosphoesterase family protein [Bradyrhizobium manausense]
MVRINLVSDLHVDIAYNDLDSMPQVDADVTVVAGDAAAPGTLALRRVRELYPNRGRPLIYVPGNHDFYSFHDKSCSELKTTWEQQRARMPEVAEELGIILLDDSSDEIGGVLFVGATLWTDFMTRPPYVMFDDAVRAATKQMNDYRAIKTGAGRSRDRLRPGQTIDAHKASVTFIERALAKRPAGQEAVVVTHMAPSPRSLLRWPTISDLDWCYASDVERLMTGDAAPNLWLHGHVHSNHDYSVGRTRVVSNPRGYPAPRGKRENPDFDPSKVVEVKGKPPLEMAASERQQTMADIAVASEPLMA